MNNLFMKKHPLIIAVVGLMASCVHEFPYTQGGVDNNTIVVEGAVTNEYQNHQIIITKLSSYGDTIRNGVKGAFVAVSAGDSTYFYTEKGNGLYESKNKYVGVAGNVYFMHINLGDTLVISAQSKMLPVTPPDKLTFNHLPDGNLSLMHIAESFVQDNPAKYVLHLSWKDKESDVTRKANIYYYSLTTVDISQLFAPKVQQTHFPKGTKIIERKYSIDNGYENYLRSLLAEAWWSGGYFDEAHGNLHTNIISDKANISTAGYFSASTVYIDTLIAQ